MYYFRIVYQRYIILCDICQNIVRTYITEEIYRKHNTLVYSNLFLKDDADEIFVALMKFSWKINLTINEYILNITIQIFDANGDIMDIVKNNH